MCTLVVNVRGDNFVFAASFVWGALFIVAGNLLTLVSGYDNRVDFGKFDPAAEWVPVEPDKLAELRCIGVTYVPSVIAPNAIVGEPLALPRQR